MRDFRAEIKRFTRDNARIASLNDHRSSSNDPSSMQKKKKKSIRIREILFISVERIIFDF